jgi:hypothetical protein
MRNRDNYNRRRTRNHYWDDTPTHHRRGYDDYDVHNMDLTYSDSDTDDNYLYERNLRDSYYDNDRDYNRNNDRNDNRNSYYGNRNVFQRAGDRVRDVWDNITDNDNYERGYDEFENDRYQGNYMRDENRYGNYGRDEDRYGRPENRGRGQRRVGRFFDRVGNRIRNTWDDLTENENWDDNARYSDRNLRLRNRRKNYVYSR